MNSAIVRHDDETFTEYDADGSVVGYGDWRDDADAAPAETLEPINDLADWDTADLTWHKRYYQWQARFDAVWNQRVAEINRELSRRSI